eukprot:1182907-Alexandrium_andersonii.AAC.1
MRSRGMQPNLRCNPEGALTRVHMYSCTRLGVYECAWWVVELWRCTGSMGVRLCAHTCVCVCARGG